MSEQRPNILRMLEEFNECAAADTNELQEAEKDHIDLMNNVSDLLKGTRFEGIVICHDPKTGSVITATTLRGSQREAMLQLYEILTMPE